MSTMARWDLMAPTVTGGTTLTDAHYQALDLDGQFYVNVHSDSNMDGESKPSSGRSPCVAPMWYAVLSLLKSGGELQDIGLLYRDVAQRFQLLSHT